jgi:Ran GTPase-activating protein (RanGAP) involved in mRNA processing and transport
MMWLPSSIISDISVRYSTSIAHRYPGSKHLSSLLLYIFTLIYLIMRLNSPLGFGSLDDYVVDTLDKLQKKDPTVTKLHIDDFHYPDVDLEGDEYLDSATIASLFQQAKHSPHVQELELRFVTIDRTVATALVELLQHQRQQADHEWTSISITGCSGLSDADADKDEDADRGSQVFMALCMALEKCQRLVLNHNQISYAGFCSLGMMLRFNTYITTLHLKREVLQGDNARALFGGISSNTTTPLTELVLNFCRFDDEGVDALCDCVTYNTSIRVLDMGACYLTDAQVERLVLSLVGHPLLHTLVLTLNSCHARGSTAMAQLLGHENCRLRTLDVSHQKNDGNRSQSPSPSDEQKKIQISAALVGALKINTSLTSLHLSRNRLLTQDILPLISVLSSSDDNNVNVNVNANATLQVLDLNNNSIDDDGIQHMAEALPTMTGLRKLYLLNNHISSAKVNCLEKGLQRNSIMHELHVKESLLKGCEKIPYRLALNQGGRQLLTTTKHVPLALWPHVLERATTATTDTNMTTTTKQHATHKHKYYLDVVYHLVQGPVLLHRRQR